MRLSGTLLLNAMLMALVTGAQAQTVDTIDPTLRSNVDRIAAQVLEQTGVPSASVAVVKDGKLVYTHAYGKARLEPQVAGHALGRFQVFTRLRDDLGKNPPRRLRVPCR